VTKALALLFVVFSFPPPTFNQNGSDCPEGFRYVGTLHGSSGSGEDFNKVVEVKLPANATFDKSYRQPIRKAMPRCRNGSKRAMAYGSETISFLTKRSIVRLPEINLFRRAI
jgi:hypothetical protein